jgi:hypothetical protein
MMSPLGYCTVGMILRTLSPPPPGFLLQLLRNSLLPDPQGRCCLAQKTAAFVVTWRVEMKRAASEEDSLACAG